MAESSIVEFSLDHSGHSCGYCHSSSSNYSHGMWAHCMTVEDYQDLIDRGWRRSGQYVYKPTMNLTCCPQYPIRCEVASLRLTKSQKRAIKRVNRYLSHGERMAEMSVEPERHAREELPDAAAAVMKDNVQLQEAVSSVETGSVTVAGPSASLLTEMPSSGRCDKKVTQKTPKPGVGLDPTKPPPKKAKQLRLERKMAKRSQSVAAVDNSDALPAKKRNEPKSLEDYLNDVVENPVHKLELRLLRSHPRSGEFDEKFSASHEVYHKYQTRIHNDPPSKPSERQYTRFLVDSPLSEETAEDCSLPGGYGSFHQQYVLDGKIIAVGVIDILSRCVSSVYFYYDPEFAFLSLGTYSALREIAFTRHLSRIVPQIAHYYLGFYVHSCPKMRYKGQYEPSYLCCPETYTWHPLSECAPKLDVSKYSRFAPASVEDEDQLADIAHVLCLYRRMALPYPIYVQFKKRETKREPTDAQEVKQYAGFVGGKCAGRMLLYRH